jgi:hypothetical protein
LFRLWSDPTPGVAGAPVLFSVLLHRLNAMVREMTVAQAAIAEVLRSKRHDEVREAKGGRLDDGSVLG